MYSHFGSWLQFIIRPTVSVIQGRKVKLGCQMTVQLMSKTFFALADSFSCFSVLDREKQYWRSCQSDTKFSAVWHPLGVLKVHFIIAAHCSKSSFFCPKIQLWFFGWKTRENVVFFGLYSCWQLWFHEKNCQKNWMKNSWKCWGFVKIEFLDKNLTFRIVWGSR